MKRLAALGLGSLIAVSTGCVPVERYNALRLEARQNEEARNSAESKERAAREKADTLQRQLDALMTSGGTNADLAASLQQQLAAKQVELDALNKRYAEAIATAGAAGSMLPAPLTNELSKLAADNATPGPQ